MRSLKEQLTCCSKCSHSPEKPCRDLAKCLLDGPVCHTHPEAHEERRKSIQALLRTDVDRPTVYVGMGTCGIGARADRTMEAVQHWAETRNIEVDRVAVACIGLCSAEPLVDIQLPGCPRVSFQKVTADKVEALLDDVLAGKLSSELMLGQFRSQHKAYDAPFLDEHPFFKPQTRWVLKSCGIINPTSIDEYIAHGGYQALSKTLLTTPPQDACDLVEKSGLRGRGGGGFPAGTKWKFARKTVSEQKYLICNADEGDPGAFMDRAVIEGDPHRLVEGMAIAAYAIGARKAYVYIRAEYPLAIKHIRKAIDDAKAYGFLGRNILDSGFDLEIVIKQGAGAFVCGEETALMHSIEGRRGMPRPRPPFPAVRGLFGKPTVINNVETLANLPHLMDIGADQFATLGTKSSKGTKVFALSGKVTRTGLVEVAMGTTMRRIIFDIGGGVPNGKKYKAAQIGGPSGGCIPTEHLDIDVDYESLKQVGAMMGSGGLVVMDESTCMVDVAKFFMDFIQRESCGKCIPCREGTRRMLEILTALSRSRRNETGTAALTRFQGVMNLTSLAEVIRDTSLCGLGQTASNPVLSTLRYFRHEYEEHVFERHCSAGVCKELLHYTIDADKCTGCTLCAKKCPSEAIMGTLKTPHYIVEDKCIGCGTCVDVCRKDAVKAA